MSIKLIAYDLHQPGQNYDLLSFIKTFPYAQLSESSYAVKCQMPPDELYNGLSQYLDKNDQLLILTLSKPMAGQGFGNVVDWLEQHL